MIRVAVLDDYQDVARKYADWSSLSGDAEISIFNDHLTEFDDLIARLRGFDVLCINRERTPMTRALIEKLDKLKLIVTTGYNNTSIDVRAARDHGVLVCGTKPDAEFCSELTWGLILALVRNIPAEFQSIRNGGWQTTVGCGLQGRTLGILGLGNIGTQVACVAHAFNMKVIAWSENLTAQNAAERGVQLVSKEGLFSNSDILTIHTKLSARTHKIVGAREIDLMKSTAYLINTARGPIIDETTLIDALVNRRIAGAALDVFDVEPLPAGHPFTRMDNVILTPHVGGVTEERYRGRFQDTVDDIRAWLDGTPIREFGLNGRLAAFESAGK